MRSFVRRFLRITVFMVTLFLFPAMAAAFGFSADVVSGDGKEVMSGKIYISDDKMRTEFSEMISIVRVDKKVVWMLMPEEKMYMETVFQMSPKHQIPKAEASPDEVERVFIGKETVNGYATDKYRVTVKGHKEGSHYVWISTDLGLPLPVKSAALDGSWWQEYRNIKVGSPNASLFEIPSGYQKVDMPIGIMGGL